MKLIILLLLSATCYGQDYTFIDTNAVKELGKTFERIKNTTQRMVKNEIDTPLDSIAVDSMNDNNVNELYDSSRFMNRELYSDILSSHSQLSLEEKLLLYAQECWNDSMKEIKNSRYVKGKELTKDKAFSIGSFIISKENKYYAYKYIHRKPTFEGFIKWLQKNK